MVGGVVIYYKDEGKEVFLDCKERNRKDTCGIMVESNRISRAIGLGDSVWWQGEFAYFTPKASKMKQQGIDFDIEIKRIGPSGVRRKHE